jgi:NADH:ubiquinone oxidoreductase subunit K
MEHDTVRQFLIIMISINAVMIGVDADHNNASTRDIFLVIEGVFLLLFVTELTLNLIGLGWLFFDEYWHHIDAAVVVISTVDFALSLASSGASTGLSVVRLVRVLRILRVISHSDKLAYLVGSFIKGMQGLMWVILLLCLFLYIFAVLAKAFFDDNVSHRRPPVYMYVDDSSLTLDGRVQCPLTFSILHVLVAHYSQSSQPSLQRRAWMRIDCGEPYHNQWSPYFRLRRTTALL